MQAQELRQFNRSWQVNMNRDYLPKGTKKDAGTWSPIVEEIDGRRIVVGAFVRCPECGMERALHHEILNTGEVNPVFACPAQLCSYRKEIHLDEWTGGHLPISTE